MCENEVCECVIFRVRRTGVDFQLPTTPIWYRQLHLAKFRRDSAHTLSYLRGAFISERPPQRCKAGSNLSSAGRPGAEIRF